MNSLETKNKSEGTDTSFNNSQITRQSELVATSNSLLLPLKKRSGQRKHAMQLGEQNLLTTSRVTRISSGTITPRSFSDLRKASIKTKDKRVRTVSAGKKEGASPSTQKQRKHLKSNDRSVENIEIQGLQNKGTTSGNSLTLPNSNPRPHDTVSGSTEMIVPSSVVRNGKPSRTPYATQNLDETGNPKSTVSRQQTGRKRKHDMLSSINNCEEHHHALGMHEISCDGEQSQDAIADEVVTDCVLSNRESNVCDDSGSEVDSTALPLAADGIECSEFVADRLKLDHFVNELESKQLDKADISFDENPHNATYENEVKNAEYPTEAHAETHTETHTEIHTETHTETHTNSGMCVEGVNEQYRAEHTMLASEEQCSSNTHEEHYSSNTHEERCSSNTHEEQGSSNTHEEQCSSNTHEEQCSSSTEEEGLQIFDAYNPDEYKPNESRKNPKKPGQRKQLNFRCSTCKLRFFETSDELEVHTECHVAGKPGDRESYRCHICPYSSPFWSRMLSHIIVHDEYKTRLAETKLAQNILGKFLCPECGRSFERKVNMQGHLKKVHFKENHTCDQCGLTLNGVDKKTFVRHQEKCRNVKIACTFCDYTTTVTTNMQKHMKVHNGEGFSCTDCSAVFPTRQRFQVHMLTHQTDRPRYGCEYCGMLFVSEDSVKKHCARLHEPIERSIACPHCPYVARMKVDLKKHVQAVHEKRHKCAHCPYSTNSEHAFDQHKTYHLADRVFACSFTGCFYRGATAKQVALHHASVHHLDSKHQCPICRKYYKKKTHLLRHLVSHTGDRAYACLECGQSFYSHSSYYRHRRRMRHDENREGVASVPQNITIQYYDEAAAQGVPGNPSGVLEVTPADEDVSNVRVIYEQMPEQPPRSATTARLELTSLLTGVGQDLVVGEPKGDGNAITYLVEVKRDANGGLNQEYYAISEQCNSGLEQGYYISSVVENNAENALEVPPSGGKNRLEAPQYTLVVLPKEGATPS